MLVVLYNNKRPKVILFASPNIALLSDFSPLLRFVSKKYVPLCQYTDILFYNIVLVARVWQVKKKFKFTFFGKSVLYRIMIYLLSLFLKCLVNLKLSNSEQCNQFFFLRRLYMYLVKTALYDIGDDTFFSIVFCLLYFGLPIRLQNTLD